MSAMEHKILKAKAKCIKSRARAKKLQSLALLEKIATLSNLLDSDHLDGITRDIMGRKLDELVRKL